MNVSQCGRDEEKEAKEPPVLKDGGMRSEGMRAEESPRVDVTDTGEIGRWELGRKK